MQIILIAAVARNRAIGIDNGLPWHLPEDLKSFKRRTRGHTLLMGRRTWESLDGHPLPGRRTIVLSTTLEGAPENVVVVSTLEEGIECARSAGEEELFIAGGGSVYAAGEPYTDQMLLTWVDTEVDGHAFFPDVDMSLWRESGRQDFVADDRHAFAFSIRSYDRLEAGR